MKKGIAAILLVLYVAFSSGVVINYHYCMDSFDSVQFGANKSDYCGVCGMHKSEGNECCKDEVKIFKIQDDQQTCAISFKFTSPDAVIPRYRFGMKHFWLNQLINFSYIHILLR